MNKITKLIPYPFLSKSVVSLILFIGLTFSTIQAQLFVQVQGGAFIGSPYTFDGVPEGSTGSPVIGPYGGISIGYHLTERFSIRIGGNYAEKGSEYLVPISGKTRVERSLFGLNFEIPFNVSYEGTAEGAYANKYIDIPLSFVYRNRSGKISVIAGPYASYLLEGSHTGTVDVRISRLFNINDEPFDQSDLIDTWDLGAHAGVEVRVFKRLYFMADAMLGLVPIFAENPEGLEGFYRNIYMRTGLSYRMGKN